MHKIQQLFKELYQYQIDSKKTKGIILNAIDNNWQITSHPAYSFNNTLEGKTWERINERQDELKSQIANTYKINIFEKLRELHQLNFEITREMERLGINYPLIDFNVNFSTRDIDQPPLNPFHLIYHFLIGKFKSFTEFKNRIVKEEEVFFEEDITKENMAGSFPFQLAIKDAKFILTKYYIIEGERITAIGKGLRLQFSKNDKFYDSHFEFSEKWLNDKLKDLVNQDDIEDRLLTFSKNSSIEKINQIIQEIKKIVG